MFIVVLACAAASFGIAQDLYWEVPEILVPAGGRFPQAQVRNDLFVVAWQESEQAPGGRLKLYLSVKTSRDGAVWRENRRFAGPFDFLGSEASIFSLAMDERGGIYCTALVEDDRLRFYSSRDEGASFQESSVSTSLGTTLAPRLFVKTDRTLLLFVTQNRNDILTLFYSTSDDGRVWERFLPLVTEPNLTLSFLPHHVSHRGRDYVAFQAQLAGEAGSYQLYLKTSTDGGRSWGQARWLSGFDEPMPGRTSRPNLFDNQRPHLAPINGRLGLAWERKFGRDARQIYYAELDEHGEFALRPERVTTGTKESGFPRIIPFGSSIYLSWFDNRSGEDHVILARKSGVFWADKDLSVLPGISTFARPVSFKGGLHLVWENRIGEASRLVLLKPDTSVPAPQAAALNFPAGGRSRESNPRVRWSLPRDPSGIAGFSYEWSRSPRPNLTRRIMVNDNVRDAAFAAGEDGLWYFHVSAQDFAGNWSEPASLSYYRDTTPPGAVAFDPPALDERGYLVSNSFEQAWKPAGDKDVAGYTLAFRYLSDAPESFDLRGLPEPQLPRQLQTNQALSKYQNIDNGLWLLSVAAIDEVGNVGPPASLALKLDKYVPVTYISFVDAVRDDLGVVSLNIQGRGFVEDGRISRVILDRDGRAPWDYEFPAAEGLYTVRSDRTIAGPALQEVKDGAYRVGVLHPLRGLALARGELRLEASGALKYGDFTIIRRPGLVGRPAKPLSLSFTDIVIAAAVLFFLAAAVFSVRRLASLAAENRQMWELASRLGEGRELAWRELEKRLQMIKTKGMGLRLKFTLFISILVMSVVLMVSIPLAVTTEGRQRQILAEGLRQQTEVLLESLVSGARSYLPSANSLELGQLPVQISAMADARFATISGRGATDLRNYNYVWGSNDPDIGRKTGAAALERGLSRIEDELSEKERQLAEAINTEAKAQIAEVAREIDQLGLRGRALAVRPDAASQAELQDVQRRLGELEARVIEALRGLANRNIGSLPAFDTEAMSATNTFFVFYKPVLYRSGGEETFFRGMVRLGVSTERIKAEIAEARFNLILSIALVSAIALALGIAGALVLSALTVSPIMRLVNHVKVIGETEDKESLEDHLIELRSRDELFTLADTVNEMTKGLVKAAAASKLLSFGKDVQKAYLPLDRNPKDSDKKMPTGSYQDDFVEMFGFYEGAKGVSGDYFEFLPLETFQDPLLDDKAKLQKADNYAIIKCDVSGKGVSAALLMFEVATLFMDHYLKNHEPKKSRRKLTEMATNINTVLEKRAFRGMFAAFMTGQYNKRTGELTLCHAGDRDLHKYDAASRKMTKEELPRAPATGTISTDLIPLPQRFPQYERMLNPGDILFLMTDGFEESQRSLRGPDFQPRPASEAEVKAGQVFGIDKYDPDKPPLTETLGYERITPLVEAVMKRGTFKLVKSLDPLGDEELEFDFSECNGTAGEVVLAMVAVEKIFRLVPDPSAGPNDRVQLDKNVCVFLEKHFRQFHKYFHHEITDELLQRIDARMLADMFPYRYFTHIREDDQYDDLTIMVIRKK